MNLLVDFILRHPRAGWLLGAVADFGLWIRPWLAAALWCLSAAFVVLGAFAAAAGLWAVFGTCAGFVALAPVLGVGMNRAARRLEALGSGLREEPGR